MRQPINSPLTRILTACVLLALALAASRVTAAVPPLTNYQGYLTDATGQPISGSKPMTFGLYADSTGGSALWSESYESVFVAAGVFNVLLGTVTPLPSSVFTGAKLWLQTQVETVTIQPRRPIATVAYCFHAQTADVAQVVASELWETDGTDVYRSTGNVGIGTGNPSERLQVTGTVHSTTGGFKFPDGSVQTTAASLGAGNAFVGMVGAGNHVFALNRCGDVFSARNDNPCGFVYCTTIPAAGQNFVAMAYTINGSIVWALTESGEVWRAIYDPNSCLVSWSACPTAIAAVCSGQ